MHRRHGKIHMFKAAKLLHMDVKMLVRIDATKPLKSQRPNGTCSRCLKITEKVSFNNASDASYVYILSGQKLIKNVKNGPFWRVFENLKLAVKQCYQTGQF